MNGAVSSQSDLLLTGSHGCRCRAAGSRQRCGHGVSLYKRQFGIQMHGTFAFSLRWSASVGLSSASAVLALELLRFAMWFFSASTSLVSVLAFDLLHRIVASPFAQFVEPRIFSKSCAMLALESCCFDRYHCHYHLLSHALLWYSLLSWL